jgi:hypothetical protein
MLVVSPSLRPQTPACNQSAFAFQRAGARSGVETSIT